MTKSAREVIAESVGAIRDEAIRDGKKWSDESCADYHLYALDLAGYVILPKEPSEGMIFAGAAAIKENVFHCGIAAAHAYRAMISHAEGEKDS